MTIKDEERLAKIETDLQWIKDRMEQGDCIFSEVKKILVGNGSLGLVAKVNILWYAHATVAGIVGSVLGSCATFVVVKLMGG